MAIIIKEQTGKEVKITLLYAGGYDEAFAKIRDGFAAGDTPTMAIAYPDHVAEYLVQEGSTHGRYVVDLNTLVNDSEIGFNKQS